MAWLATTTNTYNYNIIITYEYYISTLITRVSSYLIMSISSSLYSSGYKDMLMTMPATCTHHTPVSHVLDNIYQLSTHTHTHTACLSLWNKLQLSVRAIYQRSQYKVSVRNNYCRDNIINLHIIRNINSQVKFNSPLITRRRNGDKFKRIINSTQIRGQPDRQTDTRVCMVTRRQ